MPKSHRVASPTLRCARNRASDGTAPRGRDAPKYLRTRRPLVVRTRVAAPLSAMGELTAVPPPRPEAPSAANAAETNAAGEPERSAAAASQDGMRPRRYENWGARSVECYEKLEQIGEGTYGQVRARRARETREGRSWGKDAAARSRSRMFVERARRGWGFKTCH